MNENQILILVSGILGLIIIIYLILEHFKNSDKKLQTQIDDIKDYLKKIEEANKKELEEKSKIKPNDENTITKINFCNKIYEIYNDNENLYLPFVFHNDYIYYLKLTTDNLYPLFKSFMESNDFIKISSDEDLINIYKKMRSLYDKSKEEV